MDSQIASDIITCKTDAAWEKDRKLAGFGWIFSGGHLVTPISGSGTQRFIGSPLCAEAIAMQSALTAATTLGFRSLKVFSDNSTLIRAIQGKAQSKEIIGIVSDIRMISSGFDVIVFSFFPRSDNVLADKLAKQALRTSPFVF